MTNSAGRTIATPIWTKGAETFQRLRNFDVYLDYHNERLYFQPNERFKSRWPDAAAALAGSGGS